MASNWRKKARAAIDKVLAANKQATPAELKKFIDAAYPFECRENHPYKAWLIERNKALVHLGLASPKPRRHLPAEIPGQIKLFE